MDHSPWKREMPMAALRTQEDLKGWLVGCDKDIGGFSEAHLEITKNGTGKSSRFYGHLSLDLPENEDVEKSGYAGIRTKTRPGSVFGTPVWDTCLYEYLSLRVKGDERKYFVNLQTDGVVPTDLYQHRLFLKTPGEWETVLIPFKDFILTNQGFIQEDQIEIYRERVKNVGVSIIDRKSGPFELEIESISAANVGPDPNAPQPENEHH
ncbi:NADH:ubiquinone oxidoreductase intermediate-associated protein 30 [Gamsiella multidivaricata]|uniref:NADH:ubiquinone oxidoreductase intermediate-associated protein 30 n=1 Tax=Gamsiella multidivaricata TaxID=101098 RepID=UPI00221EC584|nr:NADH:ubiquinone oxidoreductase intermediate-associated protein 30 [Gamsiella multidivaricata]KAI7819830.1 NADH:ubiquinone oxidoreductase intermediate-associated protein 30 [Gamsiella multidivaricata]